MSDESLLRLLDVVTRELGADDARLEIGGAPPDDPRIVWRSIGASRRLVAIFAQPPSDAAAASKHLAALADAFTDSATPSVPPASQPPPAAIQARLDDQLDGLRVRTDALAALIIDGSSPALWGISHPELRSLGDAASMAAADTPPTAEDETTKRWLACAQAVRIARGKLKDAQKGLAGLRLHETSAEFGMLARGFGGGYVVIVVFDGGFSETKTEGALRRAQDHLLRLIVALPSIDPPPDEPRSKGARVVALHAVRKKS